MTDGTVAEFQRWLYYQPTRRGAARGVLNQNAVLAALKSFFRFLKSEGLVIHDPAAALEYARQPKSLPRNVLTPARGQADSRGGGRFHRRWETGTGLSWRSSTPPASGKRNSVVWSHAISTSTMVCCASPSARGHVIGLCRLERWRSLR